MCFQLTSPRNAIPLERINFNSNSDNWLCRRLIGNRFGHGNPIHFYCYKNKTYSQKKHNNIVSNIHEKNFETRFRISFFRVLLGKFEIAIIWFICCINFNGKLYVHSIVKNIELKYNNLLLSSNLGFSVVLIIFLMKNFFSFVCLLFLSRVL